MADIKVWRLKPALRTGPYVRSLKFLAAGAPYPIGGWTFAADFKRPNVALAEFTLATVGSGQGYTTAGDGSADLLVMTIDETTLAAVPDTTGAVDLYHDLWGTPTAGDPVFFARLVLPLIAGV